MHSFPNFDWNQILWCLFESMSWNSERVTKGQCQRNTIQQLDFRIKTQCCYSHFIFDLNSLSSKTKRWDLRHRPKKTKNFYFSNLIKLIDKKSLIKFSKYLDATSFQLRSFDEVCSFNVFDAVFDIFKPQSKLKLYALVCNVPSCSDNIDSSQVWIKFKITLTTVKSIYKSTNARAERQSHWLHQIDTIKHTAFAKYLAAHHFGVNLLRHEWDAIA